MENSDPLGDHPLSNISNNHPGLPAHHEYLRNLVKAETFFTDLGYSFSAGHAQSSRTIENILINTENSQLSDAYEKFKDSGISASLSKYIFRLITSFTIMNYKKYSGMSELKINALYSEIENNLPWLLDVLDGYGLPRNITESELKTIIRYTLEEYSSNFHNHILNDWSPWENLSGTLTSAPCVCCGERGRLDVFFRGGGRKLYHKFMSGDEWSSWEDTSIPIASAPGSVITEDGTAHVFALTHNRTLLHIEKKENWKCCNEIGRNIVSAPAVYLCPSGDIHVFGRGIDNELWHIIRFSNGSWGTWESLGGFITSAPSVVSWDGLRIEVFARGIGNSLFHISLINNSWSEWENLGGFLTSSPSSSSRAYNRIDIFARGRDNQLLWKIWNGVNWSGWNDLGGFLTSRPTSVSWGPDRIDVFARGYNNALIYINNK